MSENKMTQEECTAKGGKWNPDAQTCDLPAEQKAVTQVLNFEQRIEAVINDTIDAKLKAMEQKLDEKIDDLLKSKEIEMEHALRKGLGLDQDPVIHASDLTKALRKAALETAPPEKKTPEAKEKAGPTGNASQDPLDQIFNIGDT